jgi:flagellar basal body-associated protein FliL
MNFKPDRSIWKSSFILIILGIALLMFTAAARSPLLSLQTQTTPTPLLVEDQTSEPVTNTTTGQAAEVNLTETPEPSPTPFPDWAMTSKDTNGLLFAGILILLIITIGTLAAVTKKAPKTKP